MSETVTQGLSHYPRPVDLIEIAAGKAKPKEAANNKAPSFTDMFSAELAQSHNLSFSKHAHQRMHSRGVELSPESMSKLAGAVDRAQAKGSRETLVLADSAAFVVDVKERNVVTVFDRHHLREGIVTEIDSAVII
jgi:flagellar operon protein